MVTKISVIGSTGSIGRQTLDIVRRYKDRFKVVALVAHSNISLLCQQILEFKPQFIGVTSNADLQPIIEANSYGAEISHGITALKGACSHIDVDLVVLSVVGVCGLTAAAEAVKLGKTLALANKESLVVGGTIITSMAQKTNAKIVPIDSEHSAIFQCLQAGRQQDLKRIILTCSGGAFRDYSIEQLKTATAQQALNHPNWSMGNKITIDCATLMNKGLEIIEARNLFNFSNIDAILHRESIVHSMVEFADNSVVSQMSYPTMELPIMYALTYPQRLPSTVPSLDFAKLKTLSFSSIDEKKFPCIALAKSVIDNPLGCAVLNSANECAVELYLQNRIGFYGIPELIDSALNNINQPTPKSVEDLLRIDTLTREYILSVTR